MPARLARAPGAPRDYSACNGCGLCRLVCPMWRRHRDPRFTPEGLAKARQHGATPTQLAEPVEACSLCGACEPVCPEGIDLPGLIMDLRREIGTEIERQIGDRPQFHESRNRGLSSISPPSAALLLPAADLRAEPALLARVQALLGLGVADDDGDDIAWALEVGAEIPQQRLQRFVAPLRGRRIVAADGLLLRQLRRWLPGSRRLSLGAALSSMASVRAKLAASDLYVIEPRAYHADYERMVKYYDQLRIATGCTFNLDLQRIAIPVDDVAQAQWILQGRKPTRIVVESLADRAAFERVGDRPVVHLADLAEN